MGARKTSDFLEKTTWTLAIILVSLALLSNFSIPRGNSENQSIIQSIETDLNESEEGVFDDIDIQQKINTSDSLK
jgi:preprotein translocase subunit SecG